jgi:hypothetical protein
VLLLVEISFLLEYSGINNTITAVKFINLTAFSK